VIRFTCKPDEIFSVVINEAIERTVDSYLNFDDSRDQEEWLCACLPRSARLFTSPEAKQQLLAVQTAHNHRQLHDLTKHHWLLLYEALETFSHEFNEQPTGPLTERYGIVRLNFSRIVNLFFWDTAFLEETGARMTRHERQIMVIMPESLGLMAGFKHHPDELAIHRTDPALERDFQAQEVVPWNSSAHEYPIP
jgi:hypothetical protein